MGLGAERTTPGIWTERDPGYDRAFAAAVMAVAGAIGVIIPPSITMVNFGVVGGVSISGLFAAGFGPGILVGISLMVVCYITAKKHGYGVKRKFDLGHVARSFKSALAALIMPVIILGGIYGGIFTPTEAAAVSVVYGLFVGMVIYREVSFRDLFDILVDSAKTTGGIMLIVASASLFSFVCTKFGIADAASGLLGSIAHNQFVFLLIVNVIFLIA